MHPTKESAYTNPSQLHTLQSSHKSRVAFGIDAAYRISGLGKFIYHLVLILSFGLHFLNILDEESSVRLAKCLSASLHCHHAFGDLLVCYGRKVGARHGIRNAR